MSSPQTPPEVLTGQLDWVCTNINNNLDFVPDDKLAWKPAPDSKSVLDIINHATGTVNYFTSKLKGEEPTDLPPATTREAAKSLVSQVVKAHQEYLSKMTPEEGEELMDSPIGEQPKALFAGLPVVELINHHGQITYIQSMLGDNESHLVFS